MPRATPSACTRWRRSRSAEAGCLPGAVVSSTSAPAPPPTRARAAHSIHLSRAIMYAILSHGGRQYRVSAGDRLVVDRLEAEVGSVIALEPILLTGGDGATGLGREIEGMRVAATVVAHTRGRKLRIFKYKAKKRYRKVAGHRSDLTELRVESILAKGAALPEAPAARAERTDSAAAEASADKAAAAPDRA